MATITLRGIKKSYGKVAVIHGVDADIADGELIVIVGPSGCGKSTLLRMVAGLEVVTEGEVQIDGRRVNEVEPKDRDIAMVFQTYALYPHMSVFDNMAYGLKIARLPKKEIRTRVEETAKLLALSELLKRKPRDLSGGQRQRVAMGRAIVRQPSVFLFDEPLSNLDALLRVQMRLEIKQLQRRLGITSLYVTHDQVEAMTMADRLIVMNAGVAEQIDSPMQVYENPASRFVAGFIGSPGMNFLEGVVNQKSGTLSLDNGVQVALSHADLSAIDGRRVTAGFRPEHLRLVATVDSASTPHADTDMVLQVVTVETLGAETLLHGTVAGPNDNPEGSLVDSVHSALAVRIPGTVDVKEGERCALQVSGGGWHFFDVESGRRLQEQRH